MPSHLHLTKWLTEALMRSLTQWNRLLFEMLIVSQLANKSPAFFEMRTVIDVFMTACHLFLSWAKLIHVLPFCTFKIHFNIIRLRSDLVSDIFPSSFPTKILYAHHFSSYVVHASPVLSSFTWWWGAHIVALLIVQFPWTPRYFLPLTSKYLPQ